MVRARVTWHSDAGYQQEQSFLPEETWKCPHRHKLFIKLNTSWWSHDPQRHSRKNSSSAIDHSWIKSGFLILLNIKYWELPSGLVVKIQHFHCRGLGSIPGSGNWDPTSQGAAKQQQQLREVLLFHFTDEDTEDQSDYRRGGWLTTGLTAQPWPKGQVHHQLLPGNCQQQFLEDLLPCTMIKCLKEYRIIPRPEFSKEISKLVTLYASFHAVYRPVEYPGQITEFYQSLEGTGSNSRQSIQKACTVLKLISPGCSLLLAKMPFNCESCLLK